MAQLMMIGFAVGTADGALGVALAFDGSWLRIVPPFGVPGGAPLAVASARQTKRARRGRG